MKKAVISTGGRQYIVGEGEELDVPHLLATDKGIVSFDPLLIIDGDKLQIGQPYLEKNKVVASITEPEKKGEKTTSIMFKAKKRVHKVRGHRQVLSAIKVTKIS